MLLLSCASVSSTAYCVLNTNTMYILYGSCDSDCAAIFGYPFYTHILIQVIPKAMQNEFCHIFD